MQLIICSREEGIFFFYLPTCINRVDLKMDINIQSDGTHTHKRLTLKMQGYKIV